MAPQTNTIPQYPLYALEAHQELAKMGTLETIEKLLSKKYPEITPYPGELSSKELFPKATGIFINPDDNNWQFLTENLLDPKEIFQEGIDETFVFNIKVGNKILPVFVY